MLTKKKLENFLWNAVQLQDCDEKVLKGWFVKNEHNEYVLLPFDDIWHTYILKASHIKWIMFLTNGYLQS